MHDTHKITIYVNHPAQPAWLEFLLRNTRQISARLHLPWLRRWFNLLIAAAEPSTHLTLRRPPNPTTGATECQTLTILSANLWHDWPLHRRLNERLENFARLAEQHHADILLLQEVPRTRHLLADEWLASRLGMYSLYARANGDLKVGFEEGLAVFSRFPLRQPRLHQFQTGFLPFVRRLALAAEVDTPCGRLWSISVHLALSNQQNRRQHDALRQFVNRFGDEHPVVIGGDFNAHEDQEQIKSTRLNWLDTYRRLHPQADGTTHSFRWLGGRNILRRRLDYIFLRNNLPGWRVIEARHLIADGKPHSDHHAVLTRLAPVIHP